MDNGLPKRRLKFSKDQKRGWFLLFVFLLSLMLETALLDSRFGSVVRAGAPVDVAIDAPLTGFEVKKSILSTIWKNLGKALSKAAENAVRTFTTQIAYQTAIAIAEYDKGQPLFRTESFGKIVKDARDAATGDFLDTAFQEAVGKDTNYDICNPRLDLLFPIVFQVQQEIQPRRPRCTWSQIKQNNVNYYSDPNFLTNFGASFELSETDTGAYLEFWRQKSEKEKEAKESKEGELQTTSEISPDSATGTKKSPDYLLKEQTQEDLVESPKRMQEQEMDPKRCDSAWLCAPLYVFTSTLTNRLAKRLFAGLLKGLGGNRLTIKHIVDWIKDYFGGGGEPVSVRLRGTAAGISARDAFIDLAKPNLTGTGAVDVVSQLVGDECPEDHDPEQCILSFEFGEAIRQRMTLNQALGREPFNPGQTQQFLSDTLIFGYKNVGGNENELQEPTRDQGISYSAMVVLRKYRIIPVTWEIAAQYIARYEKRAYTLGELTDLYNDVNSPFYHIIDPDWVFKAPATQCARQGFVEDVLSESCVQQGQDINDLSAPLILNDVPESQYCPNKDGVRAGGREYDDTNADGICDADQDKKVTCNRKQACVDQQSCVIEDENGNCLDFGYCLEEEDIWRFGATQCKPEFSSCIAYTNLTTGQNDNFLRRSLSISDCTSETSLNCRAYCQDGDPNQWNCTYSAMTGLASSDPTNKPALFFNGNAKKCPSTSEGCQQFIRTTDGSNFISNPDFEQFGGAVEDTTADAFGFCSSSSPLDDIGKACSLADNSECSGGQCLGWKQEGSSELRSVLFDQNPALQIMQGNPATGVEQTFDTGSPLAERRFTFSFVGFSPANVCNGGTRDVLACVVDEDCPDGGLCNGPNNPGTCQAQVKVKDPASGNVLLDQTIEYADLPGNSEAFEFLVDPSVTTSELQVVFYRTSSCHYIIDKVKLQEVEPSQQPESYTVYGSQSDLVQLNKNRRSCDVEAVGCKLYTPTNGDTPIPGIIRENDQCKDEDVGCRAFKEMSTRDNFEKIFAKPEHVSRTGKFCQNSSVDPSNYGKSCKVNSDCDVPGDPGLCLPAISLVPQSGQGCSVQEVGCEQFTNLDTGNVAEAIQYFTKIRPCVKPEDTICKSFFTWEGSATTGFQLREYLLEEDTGDGSPQRPIGVRAEPNTCDENLFRSGLDPNCQQFYDTDNRVYYRYFDQTISCTNQCHPLRNSADNEIYMAAPEESTACAPQANGCREYKGNSGNDRRVVLDNMFRLEGDNLGWTGTINPPIISSESISALSGFGSLWSAVGNGTIVSPIISKNALVKNRSYVASFWLKGTAAGAGLEAYLQDTSGDQYFMADGDPATPAIPLALSSSDWREFKVGPVTLDQTDDEDVQLVLSSIDAGAGGIYVSNIQVVENDSVYLIKQSYRTCKGEENCQTYDAAGKNYNLKTFTRLCKEEFLGCEALINTRNSHQPTGEGGKARAQIFTRPIGAAPSASQNYVIVPEDSIEYVINDPAVACFPEERGCKAVGVPTIGYKNQINSYETQYVVDNPDAYDSIMCQRSQEYCQAYIGGLNGTTVEKFKTPNENVCEYKAIPGQAGKAWFIKGTDTMCPTRFINTFPERYTPTGQVCFQTSICIKIPGPSSGKRCLFDADCNAGESCLGAPDTPQPVEPIIPCSYAGDPVCGNNACGYWAGSCPADQNTCTEFTDVQGLTEGDPESSYFYLHDVSVNTVDCEQDGVNPKRGCVAFRDNSNTTLDINSNKYCSQDIINAQAAPDFYEELRQTGTVCQDATAHCGDPNQTCENLPTDSYKAPKACLACSTNSYTCNNGTDAPCCSLPGICVVDANGAKTRVSCDDNSDCQTGQSCQLGQIFCDTNQVVKVDRDRVCDKWLSCAQSSTVTDDFGKKTNICLRREICDAGADGACTARATFPSGNLTADADIDNVIQSRIENIETIDHFSGMGRAGLRFDDNKIIQGYLPYSQMTEFGVDALDVEVPNPSFSRKQGGAVDMPPDQWYPIQINGADSAQVKTIRESTSTRIANKYMRLISLEPISGGGAFTRIPDPTTLGETTEFWVLSFKAKRRIPSSEGQNALKIRLVAEDDPGIRAENVDPVILKDYWAEYSVQLRNLGGNLAKHDVVDLEIRHAPNTISQDYVDIDDVSLKPVLVVQNLPDSNVTTYAASLVEDPARSGTADLFTYIPGVAPEYDPKYGVKSNANIHANFNRQDNPHNILGFSDDPVSLGALVSNGDGVLDNGECVSDCHGWITVDFGAAILVNKDGNDIQIQESGGADGECYTVELAGSDLQFALVPPPDPMFVCDTNPDAFGGAGRPSEIDIRDVRDPEIQDGTKPARYVRIHDQSDDGADHGGAGTPGTDVKWVKALSTIGRNNYVARSCRAYPNEKAELCQYRDLNTGVFQIGWEGYCVERHPTDPDWCLHWLPIDVISGSQNVFIQNEASLTPAPLFYCADTLSKPLPTEFWTGTDFRRRVICLSDDQSVGPTCEYELRRTDNDVVVTQEECFGNDDNSISRAQGVGLTPGQQCDVGNPGGTCGNPGTFNCPVNNNINVRADPLCPQPEVEGPGEAYKCSTIAVAYKPRAAALSLLQPGVEHSTDGEPNSANADSWALGVDTVPEQLLRTYDVDEATIHNGSGARAGDCDYIADWRGDEDHGNQKNFLRRYCADTLANCVKTLKKYYDKFRIWQWRADDENVDNCSNDNETRDSDNCTDDWGGDCRYATKDPHEDDGSGCGEPDNWNDISSWEGQVNNCDFPDNDYGGANGSSDVRYDPQGSNWQKDEDYPLYCTRLVQVVDGKGRGLPYISRVQGGLMETPQEADDVSGRNGFDDADGDGIPDGDTSNYIWNYAYTSSCTPYGATPFIDSPAEIGECKGVNIPDDENGQPLTSCEVDRMTGSCTKRDPDVPGDCEVQHVPLELYHPYNYDNSYSKGVCTQLHLGNAHYACDRLGTGIDSDAPCRVCDNNSENPGRTCVQNAECGSGKCVAVSSGQVCNDASRNKGANCVLNSDCPDGACVAAGFREQGSKAITGAARRLQQLFALSQGEWVWSGSEYVLNANAKVDWDPPIYECSGGRRQGTDEYCGVKPKVQNLTVNEQASGDITLSSGNAQITLRFEAVIDGDQGPLKNTFIDWGDSTELPQGNYEGTVHLKSYSCPVTTEPNPADPNGPPIAHCNTCPGNGQKIQIGGVWKCKYENYPKVRLKDTWRWCNVDGAENNGGCQAWDGYASSIIVGP